MIIFRILFFPFVLLFLIGSAIFTLPLLIIDKGIYNDMFMKNFMKGVNNKEDEIQ